MAADAKTAIRQAALDLGFDAVGFARPDLAAAAQRDLTTFLARGYHGDMGWLAARMPERACPRALWPEVKSVVVLGLNYAPDGDALAGLEARSHGNVSIYARGRDYHDLMKARLKQLARRIAETWPGELKIFVDTAPVMEKPLAMDGGIGWQGKHTNLVSRAYGSWLFLGEIFLSLDLAPDEPEADHCGACRACLDACPTQAFPAPYQIDARRCISYLTIEAKGQVPRELREKIGNRIYGCDDCLAVCPWNKFAQQAHEAKLQARADFCAPPLAKLAALDEAEFRAFFAGSPVKRIGHARFLRNVLVAVGNSGDSGLAPLAEARLDHISPLARGMAVWALARLLPRTEFAKCAEKWRAREKDETVRAEWQAAMIGGSDG